MIHTIFGDPEMNAFRKMASVTEESKTVFSHLNGFLLPTVFSPVAPILLGSHRLFPLHSCRKALTLCVCDFVYVAQLVHSPKLVMGCHP